ncbi:NAD(P)-dependent oxidoreductase [Streptomyces sp. NPDC017941]|uniref:NAD(P)-dependent oxidoreductase n=1 Tax=Streptomyces sp. NPDC017941 TaxID=3365018 RepID=UPI0037A61F83
MAHTNGSSTAHDVTVIGCGLMGSALARALGANGSSVTVWNRTPGRAHALAGDSITPADSLTAAVGSSPLVIACLPTYETTLSVLEPVTDWRGRTLAVLGSGTPGQAEEAQRWAEARGAAYLDGVILSYPQHIGSPEAAVLYSGPTATWAAHEQTLMSLAGASRHVADQPSAANLLNVALVGEFFITAMTAYVEAATYALRKGIPAAVVDEVTAAAVEVLRHEVGGVTAAIVSGEHESDQATLTTHAAGARLALAALREDGYDGRVLAAAIDTMTAAEQAGLGELGFSAQTKIFGTRDRERA